MKRLIDYTISDLPRGAVLRFPATWPYEDFVDALLVSLPDDNTGHTLVIATGHKAGLVLIHLPKECECQQSRSVSKQWLIDNWSKWVYPECRAEDVYILEHYAPPLPPE
ncbi:Imm45 family immunity protein [Pseudomonas simiae]|uniref:Imm45 family immunity protein n=1 Tax=Pseudomonas simiae TaxID=321846 RepID=UPI000942F596